MVHFQSWPLGFWEVVGICICIAGVNQNPTLFPTSWKGTVHHGVVRCTLLCHLGRAKESILRGVHVEIKHVFTLTSSLMMDLCHLYILMPSKRGIQYIFERMNTIYVCLLVHSFVYVTKARWNHIIKLCHLEEER